MEEQAPITIRRATLEDGPTISRLLEQLAETIEDWPFSPAWVETHLGPMLEDEDHVLLVAEAQEQPIGLLTLHLRRTLLHPAPVALIDELVVDRAWRSDKQSRGSRLEAGASSSERDRLSRGVGRRLVEEAIQVARARGACELEVSTEKTNRAAQAFYRRLGFSHEAVLMELELEGEE